MGRPVVLSNGQLFVGLDENGLVHDFYYPYVGLDNLTNARSLQHKIGVWVDGMFSWTDDGTWRVSVCFAADALISDINLESETLNLKLQLHDFIDAEYNALIRRVTIMNRADTKRDVRLFMHQVFQISRSGRADTAMYVPDDHYILDYKGRCCLLIAGRSVDGTDFDQFAVGNYGIEGKAGTYMDAEDGELTDNAVEHGGVDSVIRFRHELDAKASVTIDYWVIAGSSQSDVQAIHTHLKSYTIDRRLQAVQSRWKTWLEPSATLLENVHQQYREELQRSALIIKAHCDERGSILASGDSSIFNFGRDYYCYCWPRDAGYAIWPLMRLGIYEEAIKFFNFARDTMHPDGYLMHKYQPDRAIGSTWHPLLHGRSKELAIQEDETATVVFMLGEYYHFSQDRVLIEGMFDPFIRPAANFMSNFIDAATGLPHASYDLWEQTFLTSTYTTSVVIAALEAAAEMAEAIHPSQAEAAHWRHTAGRMRANFNVLYHPDGYFRQGFLLQPDGNLEYYDKLDISSLYGPFMFAKLPTDDERLVSTVKRVETELLNTSPIGGVIRDEHDGYFLSKPQYKGNPWIVCTLWLAQYYNAAGQVDKAEALVHWALDRTQPSGAMSEQFDPDDGSAIGVTPLVWSHAEYVNTTLDLASRQK